MATELTALTPAHTAVREVTLLEDRAHVVRAGTVSLSAGRCRLAIEEVSPVLADKTLAVRLVARGDAAARVVDAGVKRRTVVRPSAADLPEGTAPTDLQALQLQLDGLDDELAAEQVALDRMEARASGLDRIATLTYSELAEDAAWGTDVAAQWMDRLAQLSGRERDLVAARTAQAKKLAELQRKRSRLASRIAAHKDAESTEVAVVEVVVEVDQSGDFGLELDYLVPNACWRPYHTARLDNDTLAFDTDACVWQNTGEDWADCQLVFSTERPSLGTEPPQLNSDVLHVTKKSDSVVVSAREQEITTTGLGGDEGTVSQELPGIDDGGEPLTLRASDRASVPGDGRPYRVRLASFEAPAETELVAYPELSRCVLETSTQANKGGGPILAGPVDLIRDSGFVGRTSVLFIAAGEKFELGWGPVTDLRLSRTADTHAEKSRLLSSWVSRRHRIHVRLSNLGTRAYELSVRERVPVSEIDQVKIELEDEHTTDQKKPDSNGFVTWDIKLQPRGHADVELGYIFKKREDVAEI